MATTNQRTKSTKKSILPRLLPPLIIAAAALAVYFFVDFTAVSDWFRAQEFTPTTEVSRIISDLRLTDRADRIFRASHPTLKDNPAFGTICGSDSEGTSILGCYTNGGIYIKNITDPALAGILESTAAHELLHAVWARLPVDTRATLSAELDLVYRAHSDTLADRLINYEESRWHDELHSIVGTEFPEASAILSDHYADYFADRAQIVAFFKAYNSTFESLRIESEALKSQIDQLKAKIDADTTNYEDGVEELNLAISDFRRRAENGSFGNNISAFYREQSELQSRADALNSLFDQINHNIEQVNVLVEQYNQNSAALNDLTTSISAPTAPPSV